MKIIGDVPQIVLYLKRSKKALLSVNILALIAGVPVLADNSVKDFTYFTAGSSEFETNNIENDAAEFAHYDYVMGVNRFIYDELGDSTSTAWDAIHAYNPDTHISLYQLGTGTREDLTTAPTVSLNGIRRWRSSRGHPDGKIWPAHSPNSGDNFFLLDQNNALVFQYQDGQDIDYWLDFGSTSFQQYWLEATINDLLVKNHDWMEPSLDPDPLGMARAWKAQGVYVDVSLSLQPVDWGNNIVTKYATVVQWQNAMQDFMANITSGIRLNHGDQQVFFNTGGTRRTGGPNYWQAIDGLTASERPDGLLEEGAFVVRWGSSDAQFFPESDWLKQVDVLKNTDNFNVFYSSHTVLTEENPNGVDNKDGRDVSFWDVVWYSLSSYLLGKNEAADNSYLTIHRKADFSFLEEMDLDIGSAVGDYQLDTATGVNIYWREFEDAWVLVNPTSSDSSNIVLPGLGKRIGHSNFLNPLTQLETTDSIGLKSNRGTIVLKDFIVGDWQLNDINNGDIVDENGMLDGKAYGSPTLTADGIIDMAIEFDGADDYIAIEDNTEDSNTPRTLTIMGWVNPASGSVPTAMMRGSSSQRGWQLLAGPEHNGFAFITHGSGGNKRYNSNGQYLNDGQWHHIAVTVENKTDGALKFYVDGDLKFAHSMLWPFEGSTTDELLIGASSVGTSWESFWSGKMDSVTLLRKVASANDVKESYLSLASHWQLNGPKYAKKAVDSKNKLHATLKGTPTWSQESGANVNSIYFDGQNDYLIVDLFSSELNFSNKFTITAWVRPEAGTAAVAIERSQNKNNGWQLLAGTGFNGFGLIAHGSGESKRYNADGQYLNDGQWHHIAVTVENKINGAIKFYVDGDLKDTDSMLWPFTAKESETLYMGANDPMQSWGAFWSGGMYDVRIFKRELSESDIAGIFDP